MVKEFLCWIMLIASGLITAQLNPDVQITPTIYQMGIIPDSQNSSCSFEIHNRTSQLLRIDRIDAHCSCTIPEYKTMEIEPGQKRALQVEFNPRGRFGKLSWDILLHNNITRNPLVAKFEVQVLRDGIVSHHLVYFDEFRRGRQVTRELWISPPDFPQFNIKNVTWQGNYPQLPFEIVCQRKIYDGFYPEPRLAYCVRLTTRPDIPYGVTQGKLKIATNIPGQELIEVDVIARVSNELGMSFSSLDFPNGIVKGNQEQREFLVYAVEETQTFELKKVESNLPFVQAKFAPLIYQRYYQVFVTVAIPQNMPPGEFRGELLLHTTSATQPQLTMPIWGIVK